MHFHIVTLFPDVIKAYVNTSILGRAQKNKKIKISYYNPRDYSKDKHKKVDDRPYGGGPGMVMEVGSVLAAAECAIGRKKNVPVYIFAPGGILFDQKTAGLMAKKKKGQKEKHIILICGHYEGIDGRVKKILKAKELSVGPYVLTGGEVPAMIVIDAVARHVDGVLGNNLSREELRVSSSETYTRPEVFVYKGKKYRVPKVLLSGDHKKIDEWRKRKGD